MSLVADGGSVAGSVGFGVDVQGVDEVATSPGSYSRGGHGQSGWSQFARNLPPTGNRHAHNSNLSEGRFHSRTQS